LFKFEIKEVVKMTEPKELLDLEKAITAFLNLSEKDPTVVKGLEERLKQLAEDILSPIK
jgi:hypothetical protein